MEHKSTGESVAQGLLDVGGDAGQHLAVDAIKSQLEKIVGKFAAGNASRAYKIGVMIPKRVPR